MKRTGALAVWRWRPRRGLFALGSVLLIVLATIVGIPRPELWETTSFSSAVYARDGELLRLQLAADQRYRLFVPLKDISPSFIDATLLYEDRHFYRHPGINVGALGRAAWTTYVTRERRMGASTITMQLARLRFDLDTRSVGGKLRQMARALQLERHYSKDEILEAYLNLAPYGGNVEGVGTASRIYFDKPAAELTLPEALALAVVPQNPAQRAPNRQAKLPALYQARERLAAQWAEHHAMTAAQHALLQLPLQVRPARALPFRAPHLVQRLTHTGNPHASVTTTLSLPLQSAFENTLTRYLERHAHEGLTNASALLLDTRSMEVLASIGSADFHSAAISGQVDGTRAKRSPGSTLKPFVYGLAMDEGFIHPMSLLSDAPRRFGVYTPENFDRGFMGPVLATDALIYSRNVPAIDLLNRIGHNRFHQFLENGGVAGLKSADHYGLAMVLGGNELTLEEIASLYAMLANGGEWRSLAYTLEDSAVSDHEDRVRLLSKEASFLTLDMLRQHPRPHATSLPGSRASLPVAWKTGTSYAHRDAWTAGVIGPYVVVVWVGHFDGRGNPSLVGRRAAAPLFFSLVDTLMASSQVDSPADQRAMASSHLPAPELNVTQVPMCAGTGDLPNRHCPHTEPGWFIPGVSPIKVSNVFRSVPINPKTGQRLCHAAPDSIHRVFEFWPSDVVSLFNEAGIRVRQPPPFETHCPQAVTSVAGSAPTITSPSPNVTYQIRHEAAGAGDLPLTANADADVSSLFWFVNNRFIAEVPRDEALMWAPSTGRYDILVVDDHGRSDVREFRFERTQ